MDKWYEEEYGFTVEVITVSHDGKTHGHCRNGDEVGDEIGRASCRERV